MKGRMNSPVQTLLIVFLAAAMAEGRLRAGAADKTYVELKALADEYGIPCTPQAADLASAVTGIKAQNAKRSAALEVQKDFEEERAQSRFTNATLELEAAAEATQAVATQKLLNATDTASATLADTLRQLRANVDTRVAEHAAATAATTAAEGTHETARDTHETARDVASNNRKAANDTRTAETAALAIMQRSAVEDAESTYVLGCPGRRWCGGCVGGCGGVCGVSAGGPCLREVGRRAHRGGGRRLRRLGRPWDWNYGGREQWGKLICGARPR